MAEGVNGDQVRSPHAHRFRTAISLLAGIAIGAVVIALALAISASNGGPAAKWSSWSPEQDGIQGAREIADHLAPLYRISNVDQLAVVTVANVNNSPVSRSSSGAASSSSGSGGLTVAVRQDPSRGVSLIGGHTIAYNLCGIGTSNCTIGTGTPSAERMLLLRREALELALYTFKYISNTTNVVAILPPGVTHPISTLSTLSPTPPNASQATPGKPLDVALLFQHDELQPLLAQPLAASLPLPIPPSVPELNLWKQTSEATLVTQVTSRGMFTERLSTTQDGTNLILLEPLPPQ